MEPVNQNKQYRDEFVGAVQVESDAEENSCDHHGNDQCARHTDDHVFPGDTWLHALPFRLKHTSS